MAAAVQLLDKRPSAAELAQVTPRLDLGAMDEQVAQAAAEVVAQLQVAQLQRAKEMLVATGTALAALALLMVAVDQVVVVAQVVPAEMPQLE